MFSWRLWRFTFRRRQSPKEQGKVFGEWNISGRNMSYTHLVTSASTFSVATTDWVKMYCLSNFHTSQLTTNNFHVSSTRLAGRRLSCAGLWQSSTHSSIADCVSDRGTLYSSTMQGSMLWSTGPTKIAALHVQPSTQTLCFGVTNSLFDCFLSLSEKHFPTCIRHRPRVDSNYYLPPHLTSSFGKV